MLRFRLSLLLASALLLALVAFAGLAGAVFAQIQERELAQLLQRELTRVQTLLDQGAVGEQFLDTPGQAMTLQFVTRGGVVAIPNGNPQPLPLEDTPTVVKVGERSLMVASAPWVRLGMDITDALAARRTLRVSLLTSGALIAAAAMLAGLLILGRTLRPLRQLAVQADELDPRDPHLTAVTSREDEVGRVYDALRRALDAIRERQQAERDALAEVAHELAAPLSVVAGQLDALAERDRDPHVQAARDAARELLYTSQDLLSLARGELERPVDLQATDLGELAQRVAHEYPGVAVEERGDTRVLASPQRLSQVVRNLVRNALQAASRPEGVRVTVAGRGAEVRLEVVDDGPGLDEEAQRRVFDRYYTRRRAAGGSGIGLTVVRTIVEAHGGSVSVHSVPGRGSRFAVVLPSLQAEIEEG
ncbi:MAG: HAMP domain-containing sensor histidine kinase [Deinococcales bacterium]